jgi:hypothetical protein
MPQLKKLEETRGKKTKKKLETANLKQALICLG